jgi:predicted N-acyltransferase
LVLRVENSLSGVDPAAWNALVGRDDPFLEHEFLTALEQSGAVGPGTGWEPRYLLLQSGGAVRAAMACFVKHDSYGEFVFDWHWAQAYDHARMAYYPKGVLAAPFTPVTGSRLLIHPDERERRALTDDLVSGLIDWGRSLGLSGLHVLFCNEDEAESLAEHGFLRRLGYQFHWLNRDYATFDGFLDDLRSSRRKQVRKERRQIAGEGLEIVVVESDAIQGEHVEAIWSFYADTTGRKWGGAYLNRQTFEALAESWRHRLVLVLGRRNRRWVGGAMHVRKDSRLLGRYWGCLEEHPGLHFECCYYRPIEYAIERGIRLVEAGAQGEHKFLRGFVTRPTHSAHWIADPRARAAIARWLETERLEVEVTIAGYNRVSPLKHIRTAGADADESG